MLSRAIALLAILQAAHVIPGQYINAKCRIDSVTAPGADSSQPISGTIFLSQSLWGGKTSLLVRLDGFSKTSNVTRHGFHVHENGNVSNQCTAAGAHYNTAKATHGAPWDSIRHSGDLGNVEVKCGRIRAIVRDLVISLNSRDDNSILNRTLVVHAQEDDLGKGNETDSLTTGHAGARLGCCVVYKVDDFKIKSLTQACSGKSARKYAGVCELKERKAAAKKYRQTSSKDDTAEDHDDDDDDDDDCTPRPANWRRRTVQARRDQRPERRGSSDKSSDKPSSKRRPHHHHRRHHHHHHDRD